MKRAIFAASLLALAIPVFAQVSDKVAEDAYIYAYSIDEAYKFFYETAVKTDTPLNRFQNIRHLADDTYTAHPTINNDTLHLMGWLDVAAEPVIISVPDMDKGRYWVLHTMDMGHYTTSMIGARTRGTKGGHFMFAANGWKGEVPASVDEVIRVDSNLLKVMGRIMATSPEDEKVALNYMDDWNVRTLSAYLGEPGPKEKQRTYLDPEKSNWLQRVNAMLCDGSMGTADKKWLDQYKDIGLAPCNETFTPEQLSAAKKGEELGLKHIKELAPKLTSGGKSLGTREQLGNGARDLFAVGTYVGQWGLPPDESVYLKAETASNGKSLNGANGQKYRMHFKAPDVSQFWSFTVYASDNRLMAHNAINRHSRGDRTLKPDANGMYTIELSAKGDASNPNYLPIPEKDAYIIMRLYGPSKAVQEGGYTFPVIEPVAK
ncbi:DUF1254 domain-containing protein [Pseudomonas granadensis]|uniref:DUF1254 domain-containing protein n=1 Tax=Pseudomonas granadensis TaxID=1421430 RepID=A0ABX7GAU3_9PSED|nr:DUF1254 domain-containing protein [Pseudomonas granadensis]MBN6776100.1 DUF1254 domain-containing protein [Pseudomonas granadensis]MBN6807118.1 DUF1254 domain-containing protein [Pseudomonas granadensis]MBN6834034.1 DUF1254 domain-containing protein [Pseudomonas granadensis]MBN6841493.1 DUF1254 domain-containing protein [Pseudomonas granadensis]MBN6870222.1 DUF1254 domain-containing protein [Pseudomonas granadensis]